MRTIELFDICLLLTLTYRECVAAPTDAHTIKKRVNNLPVIPAGDDEVAALTQLKTKRWKLVPIKVEQVESFENKETQNSDQEKHKEQQKRSSGGNPHSLSEFSSSHQEYVNNNGEVHTSRLDDQRVDQDGEMISAFRHRDQGLAQPGQQPHFKSMSEVDVPWLSIHDKIVNEDGHANIIHENSVDINKKNADTEQTIRSLVEYIEETGDDATVASFLETLVKEGKMSESEALVYVEGIEAMLEKDKQIEDMLKSKIGEIEKEEQREDEAELILNLSDFLDLKFKSGKINKQAYDDLKGRLMETVVDIAREDPYFLSQPANEHVDPQAEQQAFF